MSLARSHPGSDDSEAIATKVMSRLTKVRAAGQRQWTACCPAHEDQNPSLSISIGQSGQLLMNCWAGCTVESITGAIGLRVADLFPAREAAATRTHQPAANKTRAVDLAAEAARFQAAISEHQIERLALDLGVRPDTLVSLGIGWADRHSLQRLGASGQGWQDEYPDGAYAFPEYAGGRVVGLGFRTMDGRKGAASGRAGSRRGLIIPQTDSTFDNTVLVVEGLSDVAACLTMGLNAIGRPSNSGGVQDIIDHLAGEDAIISGENDRKQDGSWPGRNGAIAVARQVAARAGRPIRVIMPPEGCKDIRAWLNSQAQAGLDIQDPEDAGRAADAMLARQLAAATIVPPTAEGDAEQDGDTPNDTSIRIPERLTVGSLIARYTELRRPVIHKILRRGETGNVIAAPKVGKSWQVAGVAVAVATGAPWLGTFETVAGRVLILDNELHPETTSYRMRRVIEASGVPLEEVADQIEIQNLRGCMLDIHGLGSVLSDVEPGRFSVIIMDALYRFLPPGCDENDNGAMTQVYNRIEHLARRLDCAFLLVHHTSKGSQSSKSVTDVGSGAGAQSRAVDAHLVLREHEEKGCVVLDAAGRSWPPIEPVVIRFEFPLWKVAEGLDPSLLKRERGSRPPAEPKPGKPPREEWTVEKFVKEFLGPKPKLRDELELAWKGRLSKSAANSLLNVAVDKGLAHRWQKGPSDKVRYATEPQPVTYVGGTP